MTFAAPKRKKDPAVQLCVQAFAFAKCPLVPQDAARDRLRRACAALADTALPIGLGKLHELATQAVGEPKLTSTMAEELDALARRELRERSRYTAPPQQTAAQPKQIGWSL